MSLKSESVLMRQTHCSLKASVWMHQITKLIWFKYNIKRAHVICYLGTCEVTLSETRFVSARLHWLCGEQVLKDNLKDVKEVCVYFCMFHQITLLYLVSTKNTLSSLLLSSLLLSFPLFSSQTPLLLPEIPPNINPCDSSVPKEMTWI